MTATLVHRGPDAAGLFDDERCALGFRRLAILDLSESGNQPHVTADGGVAAMLNGEVYNFHSLRAEVESSGVTLRSSGDAEVVPHLYLKYGDEFLHRLSGMFALAVFDRDRGRLVLARDRFGKKPLYYRIAGDRIDFASEPKALLAAGDLEVEPDAEALVRYLAFGYVPGTGSAFRGLARLGPGERLIADSAGVRIDRWYRAPRSGRTSGDAETDAMSASDLRERVATLRELLERAVRERLASDVPLGIFLSGGIDSGLVLAAAAAASKSGGTAPPVAFTIGFDDPALDERGLARETARHLGVSRLVEHVARPDPIEALARIARAFDEPFGDASAYPTLLVCELARRDVTVALSGDGGDECFAGYKRHRALRDAARIERYLPRGLRRSLAGLLGEAGNGVAGRGLAGQFRRFAAALGLDAAERNAYWSTYFRAPLRARFLHPDLLEASGSADPDREAAAEFTRADGSPLRRALRVDLERYLPDDLLVKTDTASMAHSLEVRCPWLSREIVEFAGTLPDDALIRGSRTKLLPRLLAEQQLPPPVARAAKRGFGVPLAAWLRGPLATTVQDWLGGPRFAARRILRDGAAAELIARHASGREDWSSYLWALLVLEAWFRRFVDRAP